MFSAEWDREPDNMISSAHMMSFDVICAFANNATQVSGKSPSAKLYGLRGLFPGKSQIAPVGHQATNEE
jgi:hypothetical protein